MRLATLLCALGLLAACGGREDDRSDGGRAAGAAAEGLPTPAGARGSVTGMPTGPGPGTVPLPGDLAPGVAAPGDDGSRPLTAEELQAAGIASIEPGSLEPDPVAGIVPPPPPPPPPAPGSAPADPAAAVGVVRDYYAALNARSYERAHALWAEGGRASGQSPAQFAGGFSQAGTMSVGIGAPGAVDRVGGMAYVEVPVEVTTTYQDGSQRHFRGIYTLRGDAGSWRIASADIREVVAD